MKKFLHIILLLVAAVFIAGCDEEEIVFDHELPAFDIMDGYILLEVIVPSNTSANDEIYIAGEFNGWDEVAAENSRWYLERSTVIEQKWGIYLDPNSFISGTSLADGYHFVSVNDGEEKDPFNNSVVRTENPATGTRTNIYITNWAAFYESASQGEIDHDGFVIYITDNTGWGEIALYAWGDKEAFGGWPGILPTGTEYVNGKNYTYFDGGAENTGLNLNLIFNNNNGGTQLDDYNITLDRDFFLNVTADGVEELEVEQTYSFWVIDNSGWDEIALYIWGSAEIYGGWPGTLPTGNTMTINGYTYIQFEIPESAYGTDSNLIFNDNNNGSQAADLNISPVEEKNYYIMTTSASAKEIDPQTYTEDGDGDDEPSGPTYSDYRIYVGDQTGWDEIYAYYYGTPGDNGGGWPGDLMTEAFTANGITYKYVNIESQFEGESISIIFNNGNGTQLADYAATANGDIVTIATTTGATADNSLDFSIWANNQTGWSTFYLYSWGDNEMYGSWPGSLPTGETKIMDGATYVQWKIPLKAIGAAHHLIFNSNSAQVGDYDITAMEARDYYFVVTTSGASEVE